MTLQTTFDTIERQLSEFADCVPRSELRVDELSKWSIAQHLDHCLLIDDGVLDTIEGGVAGARHNLARVSLTGRIVLWTGYIPRGVGRSPKAVEPRGAPDSAGLLSRIASITARLGPLAQDRGRFQEAVALRAHPYFGGFNARQWLRFIDVHQHHHLKIVRQVLRTSPRR